MVYIAFATTKNDKELGPCRYLSNPVLLECVQIGLIIFIELRFFILDKFKLQINKFLHNVKLILLYKIL